MTEEKKTPVSDSEESIQDGGSKGDEPKTEGDGKREPEGGASEISDEQELNITDVDMADDQEVADPAEQIGELEKKVKETHDRLLRTAAELDNVRKRARRDVDEAKVQGRLEVLREILPAMDSLDLALKSVDPEGKAAGIVEGVKMVRKQFLSATERFGLKPIDALKKPFDPNFHEAMAQINSNEIESGNVVEEMRKGYLLGDRLLRASMVIVSKGPVEPEDAPVEGKEAEPEDKSADENDIVLTDNETTNKEEDADSGEVEEETSKEDESGEQAPENESVKDVEVGEEQPAEREEENE